MYGSLGVKGLRSTLDTRSEQQSVSFLNFNKFRRYCGLGNKNHRTFGRTQFSAQQHVSAQKAVKVLHILNEN